MFVIYGAYRWGRRRIAYRNDVCLNCRSFVVSEQHRTIDCGHIFWIPFLPLGFRKRWHCTCCGKNPHSRTETMRVTFLAGGIVCLLLTFTAWFMPVAPQDASWTWGMRIVMPALAAFCGYRFVSYLPSIPLKQALAAVPPYSDDFCRYCNRELEGGNTKYCRSCNIERIPVYSSAQRTEA